MDRREVEKVVWRAIGEVAEEKECWPDTFMFRGREFPTTQKSVDQVVARILHPTFKRTTVAEVLAGLDSDGELDTLKAEIRAEIEEERGSVPMDVEPGHPVYTAEELRPKRNLASRMIRAIRFGRRIHLT